MNEWKKCKLRDVITFQRGHDLSKDDMKEGEYPVVGSNGIIGFHNKYTTKAPCVSIGRSGNVGNPHINMNDCWAHNTTLYVKEYYDFNPLFCYYFLKTLNLQNYAGGSAVPTLNRNHIHSLDIKVPIYVEAQKAIADVLSSLDEKIALLNSQNKTLEDLAQTYFRQWFIKGEHSGWTEKGLDEIAVFLNGLALQKYPHTTGEPLKVVKIKELNNGFSKNTDLCSSDLDEKYIVDNGDVIFAWSGSLSVDLWKYGKGALNQHLFKVTSDEYPKWFYYFWIKYHMVEFLGIAEDKATTMGHIQRHHLSDARVLIPDDFIIMNNIMIPLLEKIILNNNQIQILQKLRDTLLPKLISGEIRVKGV